MTAFIRRFREVPTLERLTEIEQIALVDATPTTPVTGVGSGALMLVGEFEDGPFDEPTEVFGENDEAARFGTLGYQYGDLIRQNASARRHLGEDWNGNGFLKGKFLRPPRKIIVRVNTNVGRVRFSPLASLRTTAGPFRLETTDTMTVAIDGAMAVAVPVLSSVTAATILGAAFGNDSGYTGGEQIGITLDSNPEVIVTFQPGDTTAAEVVARMAAQLGSNVTEGGTNQVQIVGNILGAAGRVVLRDVTTGALAAIGHAAGTTNGVGTVGSAAVQNLSAVTAAELAAILAQAGNTMTVTDAQSRVLLFSGTTASGSIAIADGAGTSLAGRIGLTAAVGADAVTALVGPATTIPAGSRVRTTAAPVQEYVSMRTLQIPQGTAAVPNLSFYEVEIRPGLDNGTLPAAAGPVNVLVDIPDGRLFSVLSVGNPTAALTENQLDVAYIRAFGATVDVTKVSREATISLSARFSDAVARAGRSNAIVASDNGNRGRAFHTRAAFGRTPTQAIADVANYRSDRVFFTYPGWRVMVPEIAEVGETGGVGFNNTGIITIGADGPLAYINSVIPPEQNPGQDTGLLTFVFGLEPIESADFTIDTYIAFKRAGICAPRVDQRGTPVYQSEVTTDLTVGRTTQKRRKMADFIQDSAAVLLLPFSKRLASDSREAAIDGVLDNFLGGLLSEDLPELMRIRAYSLTNTSTENPELLARGISARKIQVQLLSSLDTFLVDTQIGEGVVVVEEA